MLETAGSPDAGLIDIGMHEADSVMQTVSHSTDMQLKAKDGGVSKAKKGEKGHTTKGKAFYKGLTTESDYQGEDYDVFSSWLGQSA